MMGSRLVASGVGLPEKTVDNSELAALLKDVDDEWIYKRTGIKQRRVVVDENTSDLAVKAARNILERAGIEASEIDLIIVSSCTPDYHTPNLGSMVQRQIGADRAVCFGISAACSGFVFAMSVADKYISAGLARKALVIGAEVLSKATDWTDKNTCILFGDGAAGVLLEASEKEHIICEELGSRGDKSHVLTNGAFPAANAFNSVEGTSIKDSYIYMDGLEVFSFATKKLTSSIQAVLDKSLLTMNDIKYIVAHQANSRIIEVVAKKLGESMDKFYLNLERFGNTSSASIPIALNELMEQGKVKPGDKLILSGFGGGLTWGTMVLEV